MQRQVSLIIPFEQLLPIPQPRTNVRLWDAAQAAMAEVKNTFRRGYTYLVDNSGRGVGHGFWLEHWSNGTTREVVCEDRSFLVFADVGADIADATLDELLIDLIGELRKIYAARAVPQSEFYAVVQYGRRTLPGSIVAL